MRTAYNEVLRNLLFKTIKLETRLSDRQVAMLRWSQINGNVIKSTRSRNCVVGREVIDALSLLPHSDSVDLVFFGNSLSEPELNEMRPVENSQKKQNRHLLFWNNRREA